MEAGSISEFLIEVRRACPEDYDMLKTWWIKWKQDILPMDYLPRTGIMINVDNSPAACGFMYSTDSKMTMFEFPITNPFIERCKRNVAIGKLIDEAEKWAKEQGYKMIYTSKNSERFINRLKTKGYVQTTENNIHLFKDIRSI